MKLDCRPWLLDPERRGHLLGLLYNEDFLNKGFRKDRKSDLPEPILNEMNTQGLLDTFPDGSQRLSREGWLLAYNIEEYRLDAERRRIFSILEKVNIFPGSVVLDVGCGGGQTLFALADRHLSLALGVDFDITNLEFAQAFASAFHLENGRFAFQQSDGNALPFKDGSVDVLICRGALHYLHIRQALQEMARVLKPGGHIYIQGPGLRWYMQLLLKSNFLGKLKSLFVIFNGTFYFLTGRQITLKYKTRPVREVFLTVKSLRALEEIGFKIKSLESVPEKFPVGSYTLVAAKS
jgi:ubiquinone/menaquinone biosynthesis C-methylase UbiE